MNVDMSRRLAALLAAAGSAAICSAQPVFQPIPSPSLGMLPSDITAGGAVVIGNSSLTLDALEWSLVDGSARLSQHPKFDLQGCSKMSADGSIMVGFVCDFISPMDMRAVKWAGGVPQLLPHPVGRRVTHATDISEDGSIIVGSSSQSPQGSPIAVRWTSKGVQLLGTPPGQNYSNASALSSDGNVVFGTVGTWPNYGGTFRWTAAEGMTELSEPDGAQLTVFKSSNEDGTIAAGSMYLNGREVGFIWTAEDGFQTIASPDGDIQFSVHDATPDARIVVGAARAVGSPDNYAAMWTEETGIINLNEHLAALGVDLTDWHLTSASAISPDGAAIAGHGTYPGIDSYAFVVSGLGEPACPADFNDSGSVNSQDFFDFLAAFFENEPTADFNDDNAVNSQDFFDFLTAFFAGC